MAFDFATLGPIFAGAFFLGLAGTFAQKRKRGGRARGAAKNNAGRGKNLAARVIKANKSPGKKRKRLNDYIDDRLDEI